MIIIEKYQSLADYILNNKKSYEGDLTITEATAAFLNLMNIGTITDITPIHRNSKTKILEHMKLDRNSIESSVYEYLSDPDFCEQDIIENADTREILRWTKSDFIEAHHDRYSFFIIDDHIFAKKLQQEGTKS